MRALILSLVLSATGLAQAQPQADPADVASAEAIVSAVYESISGPAGPRQWDRFRSLMHPDARLQPIRKGGDTFGVGMLSIEDYISNAGAYFNENPFYEVEIASTDERYGPLVHVFSTYASLTDPDGEPFDRGINSFQLLDDGNRFWVVTVMWVAESSGVAIPTEYLPSN